MKTVDDIGYRADDVRVGWLKEGAEFEEIEQRAKQAGDVEVDISRFER